MLLSACPAAETAPVTIEGVVISPLQVAELPAEQTGILREWLVEEGSQVAAGDLIAQLDQQQAQLDLAKAELEAEQAQKQAEDDTKIRYAKKSSEVAAAELRRSQESIAQFAKSVSESQLDVERLTVEKLALETEQAEHELELLRLAARLKQQELAAARLRWEQHQIRAPFAGTVSLLRGRPGEWVETGRSVARLVAVEKLRAEGFVDATLVTGSLVGKRVLFHSTSQERAKPAQGTLRFVSPEMDPVTHQVRVWAEIENDAGQIRAGEQGNLVITVD